MTLTTPLFASASTKSPSFNTLVTILVPMMQGFFISLEIMEAWHRIPPSSVINADAFSITALNEMHHLTILDTTQVTPFGSRLCCIKSCWLKHFVIQSGVAIFPTTPARNQICARFFIPQTEFYEFRRYINLWLYPQVNV